MYRNRSRSPEWHRCSGWGDARIRHNRRCERHRTPFGHVHRLNLERPLAVSERTTGAQESGVGRRARHKLLCKRRAPWSGRISRVLNAVPSIADVLEGCHATILTTAAHRSVDIHSIWALPQPNKTGTQAAILTMRHMPGRPSTRSRRYSGILDTVDPRRSESRTGDKPSIPAESRRNRKGMRSGWAAFLGHPTHL